jgi:hypothetical protein
MLAIRAGEQFQKSAERTRNFPLAVALVSADRGNRRPEFSVGKERGKRCEEEFATMLAAGQRQHAGSSEHPWLRNWLSRKTT